MSIFNELLPKINEISNAFTKNYNDDLKVIFEVFDKFEEEYQSGRGRAREKALKEKNATTILQSINEDEDEQCKPNAIDEPKCGSSPSNKAPTDATSVTISSRSSTESVERASKKRSKNEVDGMSSPEQDKRQKRNASVKAQSIISKQVNVNLTQKLRRDNSTDKSRSRRRKEDKENAEPAPLLQIKLEKLSVAPEPTEESLPANIEVKQEPNKDDIAMPPPVAPIPRPRKNVAKDKSEDINEDDGSGKRRTTRTKKQTDGMLPPARVSARATRASSRASRPAPPEPAEDTRPKRTRPRKKVSEEPAPDFEKETTQENTVASPTEKPRPKRTRRAQKDAEKQAEPEESTQPEATTPPMTPQQPITLKEERISQPETLIPQSPILPQKGSKKQAKNQTQPTQVERPEELDETYKLDTTVNIGNSMDKTVVLPNGLYNHAPVTPKTIRAMDETVVLEKTMVLEKPKNVIMDATVVIEKDPPVAEVSEDNSLLTDDSDCGQPMTPPKQDIPPHHPASAVKEKVQQFEELASRVTRTKTRAMAKKDETTENHTPPDKISKPILSIETLNKMNSMIFNGKAPQISSSASKPRVNISSATKSFIPASTSKLSALSKHKEAAEESLRKEKDDARKKKEALLEAKREMQKRKREEKMAAAAAAREAADRERAAAMEAAARERLEKQAHADAGKLEKMREAEKKRVELARKAAEMEERRRAEDEARRLRLAEDQRRADLARRRQLDEADAMKKEAVIMAKEMEKRKKEYMEKQKIKHRLEDKTQTPLKYATTSGYSEMEPVYMCDGFQYLNSDEDEEPEDRPVPDWSTSKARRAALCVQAGVRAALVERLFLVREHSPDLRAIFPAIERARLKRTSSAVWRTPPQRRWYVATALTLTLHTRWDTPYATHPKT